MVNPTRSHGSSHLINLFRHGSVNPSCLQASAGRLIYYKASLLFPQAQNQSVPSCGFPAAVLSSCFPFGCLDTEISYDLDGR